MKRRAKMIMRRKNLMNILMRETTRWMKMKIVKTTRSETHDKMNKIFLKTKYDI